MVGLTAASYSAAREAPRPGVARAMGREPDPGVLRVVSLNVAHGRSDGLHQLFQSSEHRRATLEEIGALLAREAPQVVALQEVDGPSFWSGNFCHLSFLAQAAGFEHAVHAENVSMPFVRYGTGLLSRVALEQPLSFTFDPSPPTFSKGFALSTVEVAAGHPVDVVSVHLDFASVEVRTRQIEQLEEVLAGRDNPLVVMGDFNAEWDSDRSAVRMLAERLGLSAHAPDDRSAAAKTFPGSRTRLDWILISPSLAFERYAVLDDVVSDHLPVLADIRLR